MKYKWTVQPKPTGRYSSFEHRGWPSADYVNGSPCALITCEDNYAMHRVKSGKHGPLTLRIADHNVQNDKVGAFTWKRMTKTFATIEEAKAALVMMLEKFPHFIPKEKADDTQA